MGGSRRLAAITWAITYLALSNCLRALSAVCRAIDDKPGARYKPRRGAAQEKERDNACTEMVLPPDVNRGGGRDRSGRGRRDACVRRILADRGQPEPDRQRRFGDSGGD